MYQISCDDYILYDLRDEDLFVINPHCKLAVNTVGEGSFTILPTHPYYSRLQKLKSVFEIRQDDTVIFRGRMTTDSRDFYNRLEVDLEGALAYANDSIVPPFDFPNGADFDTSESDNVVEYLLNWILTQHNDQVQDWQKLQLGTVTVSDPNNYITRSSEQYLSTWEVLKTRLFESSLGGYLCIRYEDDGNYVDYLSEFPLTNNQHITFAENLLDITNQSDASETYTAILPIGADNLTIEDLEDTDIDDDLVKSGKYIYSKSNVDNFGWICVPIDDATWDDVTIASNLQSKAADYLTGTAMKLSSTVTVKAVDLHFTAEDIASFRIYRNVIVDSPVHGADGELYQLTELDIDLANPQNTSVTLGQTTRSLTDINEKDRAEIVRVEQEAAKLVEGAKETVQEEIATQRTELLSTCETIILSALAQYTTIANTETLRETLESQLEQTAENLTLSFSGSLETIQNNMDTEFSEWEKYFQFDGNGLTISTGDNVLQLVLDAGIIKFYKDGQVFGTWDGVDFHTCNIVIDVKKRAQFGNFAFVPRSDGSLSFLKVQ